MEFVRLLAKLPPYSVTLYKYPFDLRIHALAHAHT